MKKNQFFIVAVVVVVLGVGGFLFWRQTPPTTPPPTEAPSATGEFEAPAKVDYETFTTTDGALSFEYPAKWTRTQIQNLETILPQEFIDKYSLEMPLILSSPQGAQVTLSTYVFAADKNLNAVMDELEAALIDLGQPYDEVNRQIVGNSLVVDSEVASQGATVKVRDILLSAPRGDGNTIYNISFSTPESLWDENQAVFDHIQSSIQQSP